MRTGEIVISSGVYRADCLCHRVASFAKGDEAPKCPSCGKEVSWAIRIDEDRSPETSAGAAESTR